MLDSQVPFVWSVLLYEEQLADYARFQKWGDFAAACCTEASAFSVVSEMKRGHLHAVVHRCVGDQLGSLLPNPAVSQKKKKLEQATSTFGKVVSELLTSGKLPDGSLADLNKLNNLLVAGSAEDKVAALQALEALRDDPDYFGLLRPVLHSQHWLSFVDGLQRPAKTSSAVSELRKAFDKLSATADAGFTDEDRQNLFQAVLTAAHVPQAQSQLTAVLNGLSLTSREAEKAQLNQLKRLCSLIVAKGPGNVELSAVMELSDDILRRGYWAELEDQVGPEDAEKGSEDDSEERRSAMGALVKAGAALMKQRRTLEVVLGLAIAAQHFADKNTPETQEKLLLKWGEAKTLQQTGSSTEEMAPAVSQQLEELLAATRIPEVGPDFYKSSLDEMSRMMTQLLEESMSTNPNKDAVKKAAERVLEARHPLMQACSMSDTPGFARSCVELVCDDMVPVCVDAFQLSASCSDNAVEEKVTEFLLAHLNNVCDLEKNKQKVLHVLEQSVANKFLQHAASVKDKCLPILNNKVEGLLSRVDSATKALESELSPVALAKTSKEEFLEQCTGGDVLKKLLKALVKAERSFGQVATLAEDVKARVTSTKEHAKQQITMWGTLTLLAHEGINADTKQGASLRNALAEIWKEHGKELTQGVGEETAKQIADTTSGSFVVKKEDKGQSEAQSQTKPAKRKAAANPAATSGKKAKAKATV